MLLCISGIQYLSTLNLPDYRLSSIDKVNATTVLAGLDKLTRVLICYYVNIWSIVSDVIMHAID